MDEGDENFNLYTDLITETYTNNVNQETLVQLQKSYGESQEIVGRLKEQVDTLQSEVEKLRKKNVALNLNISSLFKTAKAEVERKTEENTRLRETVEKQQRLGRRPSVPSRSTHLSNVRNDYNTDSDAGSKPFAAYRKTDYNDDTNWNSDHGPSYCASRFHSNDRRDSFDIGSDSDASFKDRVDSQNDDSRYHNQDRRNKLHASKQQSLWTDKASGSGADNDSTSSYRNRYWSSNKKSSARDSFAGVSEKEYVEKLTVQQYVKSNVSKPSNKCENSKSVTKIQDKEKENIPSDQDECLFYPDYEIDSWEFEHEAQEAADTRITDSCKKSLRSNDRKDKEIYKSSDSRERVSSSRRHRSNSSEREAGCSSRSPTPTRISERSLSSHSPNKRLSDSRYDLKSRTDKSRDRYKSQSASRDRHKSPTKNVLSSKSYLWSSSSNDHSSKLDIRSYSGVDSEITDKHVRSRYSKSHGKYKLDRSSTRETIQTHNNRDSSSSKTSKTCNADKSSSTKAPNKHEKHRYDGKLSSTVTAIDNMSSSNKLLHTAIDINKNSSGVDQKKVDIPSETASKSTQPLIDNKGAKSGSSGKLHSEPENEKSVITLSSSAHKDNTLSSLIPAQERDSINSALDTSQTHSNDKLYSVEATDIVMNAKSSTNEILSARATETPKQCTKSVHEEHGDRSSPPEKDHKPCSKTAAFDTLSTKSDPVMLVYPQIIQTTSLDKNNGIPFTLYTDRNRIKDESRPTPLQPQLNEGKPLVKKDDTVVKTCSTSESFKNKSSYTKNDFSKSDSLSQSSSRMTNSSNMDNSSSLEVESRVTDKHVTSLSSKNHDKKKKESSSTGMTGEPIRTHSNREASSSKTSKTYNTDKSSSTKTSNKQRHDSKSSSSVTAIDIKSSSDQPLNTAVDINKDSSGVEQKNVDIHTDTEGKSTQTLSDNKGAKSVPSGKLHSEPDKEKSVIKLRGSAHKENTSSSLIPAQERDSIKVAVDTSQTYSNDKLYSVQATNTVINTKSSPSEILNANDDETAQLSLKQIVDNSSLTEQSKTDVPVDVNKLLSYQISDTDSDMHNMLSTKTCTAVAFQNLPFSSIADYLSNEKLSAILLATKATESLEECNKSVHEWHNDRPCDTVKETSAPGPVDPRLVRGKSLVNMEDITVKMCSVSETFKEKSSSRPVDPRIVRRKSMEKISDSMIMKSYSESKPFKELATTPTLKLVDPRLVRKRTVDIIVKKPEIESFKKKSALKLVDPRLERKKSVAKKEDITLTKPTFNERQKTLASDCDIKVSSKVGASITKVDRSQYTDMLKKKKKRTNHNQDTPTPADQKMNNANSYEQMLDLVTRTIDISESLNTDRSRQAEGEAIQDSSKIDSSENLACLAYTDNVHDVISSTSAATKHGLTANSSKSTCVSDMESNDFVSPYTLAKNKAENVTGLANTIVSSDICTSPKKRKRGSSNRCKLSTADKGKRKHISTSTKDIVSQSKKDEAGQDLTVSQRESNTHSESTIKQAFVSKSSESNSKTAVCETPPGVDHSEDGHHIADNKSRRKLSMTPTNISQSSPDLASYSISSFYESAEQCNIKDVYNSGQYSTKKRKHSSGESAGKQSTDIIVQEHDVNNVIATVSSKQNTALYSGNKIDNLSEHMLQYGTCTGDGSDAADISIDRENTPKRRRHTSKLCQSEYMLGDSKDNYEKEQREAVNNLEDLKATCTKLVSQIVVEHDGDMRERLCMDIYSDGIVGSEDTIVGCADTIVASEDTIIGREDRILASEDTIVVSEDTIVGSKDTIVGSEDTIVGCADTIVASEDTIIGREDRILACEDTIVVSEDTIVGSKDTIVGSKDTIVDSEDTIVVSEDTIVVGEDTIEGSEEIVGSEDTIVGSEDTIVAREDTIVVSEDTIVVSEDTIVVSKDTIVGSEDTIVVSDDTIEGSKDTIVDREDTILDSEDMNVAREDTIVVSEDTIVVSEDTIVGSEVLIDSSSHWSDPRNNTIDKDAEQEWDLAITYEPNANIENERSNDTIENETSLNISIGSDKDDIFNVLEDNSDIHFGSKPGNSEVGCFSAEETCANSILKINSGKAFDKDNHLTNSDDIDNISISTVDTVDKTSIRITAGVNNSIIRDDSLTSQHSFADIVTNANATADTYTNSFPANVNSDKISLLTKFSGDIMESAYNNESSFKSYVDLKKFSVNGSNNDILESDLALSPSPVCSSESIQAVPMDIATDREISNILADANHLPVKEPAIKLTNICVNKKEETTQVDHEPECTKDSVVGTKDSVVSILTVSESNSPGPDEPMGSESLDVVNDPTQRVNDSMKDADGIEEREILVLPFQAINAEPIRPTGAEGDITILENASQRLNNTNDNADYLSLTKDIDAESQVESAACSGQEELIRSDMNRCDSVVIIEEDDCDECVIQINPDQNCESIIDCRQLEEDLALSSDADSPVQRSQESKTEKPLHSVSLDQTTVAESGADICSAIGNGSIMVSDKNYDRKPLFVRAEVNNIDIIVLSDDEEDMEVDNDEKDSPMRVEKGMEIMTETEYAISYRDGDEPPMLKLINDSTIDSKNKDSTDVSECIPLDLSVRSNCTPSPSQSCPLDLSMHPCRSNRELFQNSYYFPIARACTNSIKVSPIETHRNIKTTLRHASPINSSIMEVKTMKSRQLDFNVVSEIAANTAPKTQTSEAADIDEQMSFDNAPTIISEMSTNDASADGPEISRNDVGTAVQDIHVPSNMDITLDQEITADSLSEHVQSRNASDVSQELNSNAEDIDQDIDRIVCNTSNEESDDVCLIEQVSEYFEKTCKDTHFECNSPDGNLTESSVQSNRNKMKSHECIVEQTGLASPKPFVKPINHGSACVPDIFGSPWGNISEADSESMFKLVIDAPGSVDSIGTEIEISESRDKVLSKHDVDVDQHIKPPENIGNACHADVHIGGKKQLPACSFPVRLDSQNTANVSQNNTSVSRNSSSVSQSKTSDNVLVPSPISKFETSCNDQANLPMSSNDGQSRASRPADMQSIEREKQSFKVQTTKNMPDLKSVHKYTGIKGLKIKKRESGKSEEKPLKSALIKHVEKEIDVPESNGIVSSKSVMHESESSVTSVTVSSIVSLNDGESVRSRWYKCNKTATVSKSLEKLCTDEMSSQKKSSRAHNPDSSVKKIEKLKLSRTSASDKSSNCRVPQLATIDIQNDSHSVEVEDGELSSDSDIDSTQMLSEDKTSKARLPLSPRKTHTKSYEDQTCQKQKSVVSTSVDKQNEHNHHPDARGTRQNSDRTSIANYRIPRRRRDLSRSPSRSSVRSTRNLPSQHTRNETRRSSQDSRDSSSHSKSYREPATKSNQFHSAPNKSDSRNVAIVTKPIQSHPRSPPRTNSRNRRLSSPDKENSSSKASTKSWRPPSPVGPCPYDNENSSDRSNYHDSPAKIVMNSRHDRPRRSSRVSNTRRH